MTSSNKAKLEALLKLIHLSAQQAITEYELSGGDVPSIDSAEAHSLDNTVDNIALKGAVRTLEGACAQLCATLAPPSHTVINLVQAYDYACLRVALRENVTDILADYSDGLHVNELSKLVNIDPKKLVRLMRLLSTRGCYREVETCVFANNRLSMELHSKSPVRYMVSHHVNCIAKGASVLYETLKDPNTAYSEGSEHAPIMYANKKNGVNGAFFDWITGDDNRREGYHQAMKGVGVIMGSLSILTQFPFEKYSTLVDIGGGIGAFTLPLAKMHKYMKITIQDLPQVLAEAQAIWRRDCPEAVDENRIEFAEIDFLTQIPVEGKDVYYLRNIIHDWPDQKAALILSNLRQALGPHSRVLIHDYVLRELTRKEAEAEAAFLGTPVAPEPLLPNFGVGNIRMYQQDLTMLIAHGAKERTLQNSLELASAAGLKLEKIWDLVETCVLEFSSA